MKTKIEKYYPYGASILLIAFLWIFNTFGDKTNKLARDLADNSLSMTVTLIGFFLTILTLINSIESNRMKHVKQRGQFPRLLGYLKHAINANLILLICSFLIKYMSNDFILTIKGRNPIDYLFYLIFSTTILLSFRFVNIFVMLMVDPKETKPSISAEVKKEASPN